MDIRKSKIFFLTTIASLVLIFSPFTLAGFKPDGGDLYYDGGIYSDSYFGWNTAGPFSGNIPGYEHDLRLGVGLWGGCTAFTNLPNGYSDCGTSGTSDPPGYIIFSFGSFSANNIQASTTYSGGWLFNSPLGQTNTSVQLFAQNVEHYFCIFDWVWCMNGVQYSPPLLPPNIYMYYGGYPTVLYW